MKSCETGPPVLSSLSEKTRKSYHLQMSIAKEAFSPQLIKDPECWSGRGLNLRPPARYSGTPALYQLSQPVGSKYFNHILTSQEGRAR